MNEQTQLIPAAQAAEPLPHKDYTAALLRRAAVNGTIPEERLNLLRKALQTAAADRALAYTRRRSSTVTRAQAEAFYRSVLCQLDTVLLDFHSDALAEAALREQAPEALLEAGQLRTMQLYAEAKEDFRAAYRLTEPYATAFFQELLTGFQLFCTKYDARFRAADTKVSYSYPLLGDAQITETGIVGTARYYRALRREGELLSMQNPEEMHEMMQRYADKFRTEPRMIAENLADLTLRHLMVNALAGKQGVCVSAEDAEAVRARYAGMPAETLAGTLQRSLPEASPALHSYLMQALPAVAETLSARLAADTLSGWLSAQCAAPIC